MTIDTRRTFHKELTALRDDLVHIAATVCEAIPRATQALLDGDRTAAEAVIAGDAEVDRVTVEVEDRCYHQLALQQPMASDLRALVTAVRLCAEIDRTGDLVANIAKGVGRIEGLPIDPRSRGLLQTMSDLAHELFAAAVAAYAEGDGAKGEAIDLLDDRLDEAHHAFIEQVLASSRDGALDIRVAVQLGLIGRFYERIGDHAVNIGHKVHYLASGVVS